MKFLRMFINNKFVDLHCARWIERLDAWSSIDYNLWRRIQMGGGVLCFLVAFPLAVYAQSDEVLFRRLDSLLDVQAEITKAKELRINKIKERFDVPHLSQRQEYDINESLYQEYLAFKCDFAYSYATRNIQIAKANGWWREFNQSTLEQVHILSVMALFENAQQSLATIRKEALKTREDSLAYYVCYSDLHLFGAEFTEGTPFYSLNLKAAQEGRRKAIRLASPNSMAGVTNIANFLAYNKEYGKAIRTLTRYLKNGPQIGTREYSILTSDLAHYYNCTNNHELRRHYLLLSSISDVKGAIHENTSLRELASLLMDEGNYDRAYKYINVSINDALFYGTRLRNMQTVRLVPKIIDAYHQAQVSNRRILNIVTIFISVITILLGIALFLLLRYLKRYHRTTRLVEDVNAKLNDTVGKLQRANEQLREDGQIKEQYLSRFMELASSLIYRHEETRKLACRLGREHKMNELSAMLKSNIKTTEDVKLFYSNFDNAFLNIYPNFPNAVNALMPSDSKFIVKGNSLNTELRILALLRLGITDNKRIAAILRSSITTIYTYRSKMKSRSMTKDDFENKVVTL